MVTFNFAHLGTSFFAPKKCQNDSKLRTAGKRNREKILEGKFKKTSFTEKKRKQEKVFRKIKKIGEVRECVVNVFHKKPTLANIFASLKTAQARLNE